MVSQNLHKQKFDQERNTRLKQEWFQAVWLTVAAPQPFYTKAIKIYRSAMCFLLHVGVKQPNVEKWFVPNRGHYDVRHVLTS